jgi:hypothetical protein
VQASLQRILHRSIPNRVRIGLRPEIAHVV